MREVDSTQAAELLGYSRSHFVDRVSKRRDFPKPSTNKRVALDQLLHNRGLRYA